MRNPLILLILLILLIPLILLILLTPLNLLNLLIRPPPLTRQPLLIRSTRLNLPAW